MLFTFKKSVAMKALPRYNGPHVIHTQEAPEASGEAIMAKPNSMFYCSLLGGESFDEFAHLGSLREVMEHMQDEELRHLLRRCREGGRQDWPVEAMLNAYYAMIVLQYRSIESLRRNLAANPTLMRVCGFPMKSNRKNGVRVPSKSAFSRFMKLLAQLEREHGAMYALFERNRDRLMELCPDFGTSLGFDGKKLHSYSTGRTRADGTCSDPDADWGRQVYRGVGSDGKPWSHEVKWFGYRLHLVADTRDELPFDFRVEAASVSETPVCREMMSKILSDTEAGARCVDFVADRGLDDDQLRRQLHERGVTPFIETRRMWKDEPLGDNRKPTRALCEDRVDTMVVHGMRQGVLRLSAKRRSAPHGLRWFREQAPDAEVSMPGGGIRTALCRPRRMPPHGRHLAERQATHRAHQDQRWQASHAHLRSISAQYPEMEADL